jgi:uncharacterized membrane protein YhaH (DUF805 family)
MHSTMTPIDWAKRPFQKYADFTGRAPRAEFWWFVLFVIVAAVVATILDSMLGLGHVFLLYGPLTLLVVLATLVPNIAVQVRRLHDRNQPGWWLLGFYGPYVLMLILMPGLSSGTPAAPSGLSMILGLIVFVVAIILIVMYCLAGTAGANRYGPDPYGAAATDRVPAE